MNEMRSKRSFRVLVVIALVFGFAILLLWDVLGNEIATSRIKSAILQQCAKCYDTRSEVGVLCGNGNHLDVFVAVVVDAGHPPLRPVLNPFSGSVEGVDVVDLSNIEHAWYSDHSEDWVKGWISKGKKIFYVMRSYRPNGDPRCW